MHCTKNIRGYGKLIDISPRPGYSADRLTYRINRTGRSKHRTIANWQWWWCNATVILPTAPLLSTNNNQRCFYSIWRGWCGGVWCGVAWCGWCGRRVDDYGEHCQLALVLDVLVLGEQLVEQAERALEITWEVINKHLKKLKLINWSKIVVF